MLIARKLKSTNVTLVLRTTPTLTCKVSFCDFPNETKKMRKIKRRKGKRERDTRLWEKDIAMMSSQLQQERRVK